MHSSITGATHQRSTVVAIQSQGVEVTLLNKHGVTDSLIRSVDLEKDVFKASIETLINIWVTRFGNEWVDLETIDEDDFFINAYKRLKQLGHLEQHYLTDRSRYVCRKPE